jgi:mannitol-1-phosphate 5-dehydrogenase
MDSEDVSNAVQNTLTETGNVLVKKYGFDREEHAKYIKKIVGRFQNPHIDDEIPRVARGPLRKLGANDRLVSPAKQYYQYVEGSPENLAKAIAAALKYDFPEDAEAVTLQEKVKSRGFKETLQEVSELEEGHPLVSLVLKEL